jgi:hypothetical protein
VPLALLLLAGIGFGVMRALDLPWPPWGPDYAKLLQVARDEEDALKRRIGEREAELREALARCAAEGALAAARTEEERLRKAIAERQARLKDELGLCPLKQDLKDAARHGRELERRGEALAQDLKRAIDACRRKQEEAKRKEEEARRKAEEDRKKAEAAQRKAEEDRKKEEARRAAEKSPCVTAEGDVPMMDIYFLQDLTGSFRDDLPNMNRFMADMIGRIQRGDFGKEVRVGIGSFTDKPHPVFGSASHYVFRNHLSLTDDAGRLAAAVRGLNTLPGGDEPESQYEAILEMVANAGRIGFRRDARKFVVVLTDAAPHVAGDWPPMPLLGSSRPDDGRGDGDPMDEDYPSPQQTMQALRSADITPVFLVTGPSLGIYQRFVSQSGRGAGMPLSSDSSNVMDALLAGLKKACRE